ncbi:MAG: hypothetical protein E7255_13410 [Lachnospiraceae bacterium]|nr:hypothetical protein [Lachnospiraceae bacterium]
MSDTMEQLFGYRRERATLLIPKHLKRLAEKTKEFGLDYEAFLYEHTIFPFITCFLNKASFDNALNSINNENPLCIYKHDINPKFLRYCPLCIRVDREVYGEAYWHRKHQSYGIAMCSKHKCHLRESNIEILDNRNNRYIALELMNDLNVTLEQEDIFGSSIELQIAYDINYIYENYEYIRKMLCEKHSLIRDTTIALLYRRNLATQKGLVKIDRLKQEFQNKYFLHEMKQLTVDLKDDKKSDWLITLCRGGQSTVVPIRLILFADFLAGSLEAYIKLIDEQEQFIERGKEQFSTPNGYEEKLVQYRKRWIDVWDKNPKGCRFDLVRADRPAYTWLRRHDNEWMISNSPKTMKPPGTITCKDWMEVDNELESMVNDAVSNIKNIAGKPERLTKANISRYMGQKNMIDSNYKLLPKTMKKIEGYIESTYNYRLRKIDWAICELENEGKPYTPWMILRKAGIRDEDWYKFWSYLHPDVR